MPSSTRKALAFQDNIANQVVYRPVIRAIEAGVNVEDTVRPRVDAFFGDRPVSGVLAINLIAGVHIPMSATCYRDIPLDSPVRGALLWILNAVSHASRIKNKQSAPVSTSEARRKAHRNGRRPRRAPRRPQQQPQNAFDMMAGGFANMGLDDEADEDNGDEDRVNQDRLTTVNTELPAATIQVYLETLFSEPKQGLTQEEEDREPSYVVGLRFWFVDVSNLAAQDEAELLQRRQNFVLFDLAEHNRDDRHNAVMQDEPADGPDGVQRLEAENQLRANQYNTRMQEIRAAHPLTSFAQGAYRTDGEAFLVKKAFATQISQVRMGRKAGNQRGQSSVERARRQNILNPDLAYATDDSAVCGWLYKYFRDDPCAVHVTKGQYRGACERANAGEGRNASTALEDFLALSNVMGQPDAGTVGALQSHYRSRFSKLTSARQREHVFYETDEMLHNHSRFLETFHKNPGMVRWSLLRLLCKERMMEYHTFPVRKSQRTLTNYLRTGLWSASYREVELACDEARDPHTACQERIRLRLMESLESTLPPTDDTSALTTLNWHSDCDWSHVPYPETTFLVSRAAHHPRVFIECSLPVGMYEQISPRNKTIVVPPVIAHSTDGTEPSWVPNYALYKASLGATVQTQMDRVLSNDRRQITTEVKHKCQSIFEEYIRNEILLQQTRISRLSNAVRAQECFMRAMNPRGGTAGLAPLDADSSRKALSNAARAVLSTAVGEDNRLLVSTKTLREEVHSIAKEVAGGSKVEAGLAEVHQKDFSVFFTNTATYGMDEADAEFLREVAELSSFYSPITEGVKAKRKVTKPIPTYSSMQSGAYATEHGQFDSLPDDHPMRYTYLQEADVNMHDAAELKKNTDAEADGTDGSHPLTQDLEEQLNAGNVLRQLKYWRFDHYHATIRAWTQDELQSSMHARHALKQHEQGVLPLSDAKIAEYRRKAALHPEMEPETSTATTGSQKDGRKYVVLEKSPVFQERLHRLIRICCRIAMHEIMHSSLVSPVIMSARNWMQNRLAPEQRVPSPAKLKHHLMLQQESRIWLQESFFNDAYVSQGYDGMWIGYFALQGHGRFRETKGRDGHMGVIPVFTGPPATGKSYHLKAIMSFAFPGVVQPASHITAQTYNTNINRDDVFEIQHEMRKEHLFDSESNETNQFKTMLTEHFSRTLSFRYDEEKGRVFDVSIASLQGGRMGATNEVINPHAHGKDRPASVSRMLIIHKPAMHNIGEGQSAQDRTLPDIAQDIAEEEKAFNEQKLVNWYIFILEKLFQSGACGKVEIPMFIPQTVINCALDYYADLTHVHTDDIRKRGSILELTRTCAIFHRVWEVLFTSLYDRNYPTIENTGDPSCVLNDDQVRQYHARGERPPCTVDVFIYLFIPGIIPEVRTIIDVLTATEMIWDSPLTSRIFKHFIPEEATRSPFLSIYEDGDDDPSGMKDRDRNQPAGTIDISPAYAATLEDKRKTAGRTPHWDPLIKVSKNIVARASHTRDQDQYAMNAGGATGGDSSASGKYATLSATTLHQKVHLNYSSYTGSNRDAALAKLVNLFTVYNPTKDDVKVLWDGFKDKKFFSRGVTHVAGFPCWDLASSMKHRTVGRTDYNSTLQRYSYSVLVPYAMWRSSKQLPLREDLEKLLLRGAMHQMGGDVGATQQVLPNYAANQVIFDKEDCITKIKEFIRNTDNLYDSTVGDNRHQKSSWKPPASSSRAQMLRELRLDDIDRAYAAGKITGENMTERKNRLTKMTDRELLDTLDPTNSPEEAQVQAVVDTSTDMVRAICMTLEASNLGVLSDDPKVDDQLFANILGLKTTDYIQNGTTDTGGDWFSVASRMQTVLLSVVPEPFLDRECGRMIQTGRTPAAESLRLKMRQARTHDVAGNNTSLHPSDKKQMGPRIPFPSALSVLRLRRLRTSEGGSTIYRRHFTQHTSHRKRRRAEIRATDITRQLLQREIDEYEYAWLTENICPVVSVSELLRDADMTFLGDRDIDYQIAVLANFFNGNLYRSLPNQANILRKYLQGTMSLSEIDNAVAALAKTPWNCPSYSYLWHTILDRLENGEDDPDYTPLDGALVYPGYDIMDRVRQQRIQTAQECGIAIPEYADTEAPVEEEGEGNVVMGSRGSRIFSPGVIFQSLDPSRTITEGRKETQGQSVLLAMATQMGARAVRSETPSRRYAVASRLPVRPLAGSSPSLATSDSDGMDIDENPNEGGAETAVAAHRATLPSSGALVHGAGVSTYRTPEQEYLHSIIKRRKTTRNANLRRTASGMRHSEAQWNRYLSMTTAPVPGADVPDVEMREAAPAVPQDPDVPRSETVDLREDLRENSVTLMQEGTRDPSLDFARM